MAGWTNGANQLEDTQYLYERLGSLDGAVATIHKALGVADGTTPEPVDLAPTEERIAQLAAALSAASDVRATQMGSLQKQIERHSHPPVVPQHDHAHEHDAYSKEGHAHSAIMEMLALQGQQLAKLQEMYAWLANNLNAAETVLKAQIADVVGQVEGHEHTAVPEHSHSEFAEISAPLVEQIAVLAGQLDYEQEKIIGLVNGAKADAEQAAVHNVRLTMLEGQTAEFPREIRRLEDLVHAMELSTAGHVHTAVPGHEHHELSDRRHTHHEYQLAEVAPVDEEPVPAPLRAGLRGRS